MHLNLHLRQVVTHLNHSLHSNGLNVYSIVQYPVGAKKVNEITLLGTFFFVLLFFSSSFFFFFCILISF